MRAILLAAGTGNRLRPLTNFVPKCLAPIRGRPLLDYWLELLIAGGVSKILVNTHHHSEMVRSFIEASPWRAHVQVAHEDELLGTAGTAIYNRKFIGKQAFLLIHGDNLSMFDPADFARHHASRPSGTEITMMTFRTPTPRTCGIVLVDERGIVQSFFEKVPDPPGNLANAAIYMVEPSLLQTMDRHPQRSIDFSTEVLPRLLGRIFTYENVRYHRDIGTIESWREAQEDFPGGVGDWHNPFWSDLMRSGSCQLSREIEHLLVAG